MFGFWVPRLSCSNRLGTLMTLAEDCVVKHLDDVGNAAVWVGESFILVVGDTGRVGVFDV